MTKTPPTATILAIGTELTQGQITNRNAAWISERLNARGFEVIAHVTVSDDRPRILTALDTSVRDSDLIVVTGGLGPTTDDITREAISEWSLKKLIHREASWTKIVKRLSDRGVEVAESNRQQCNFPIGATVFDNPEGTADGFHLSVEITNEEFGTPDKAEVLVLPGPPSEGKAIWLSSVEGWLQSAFPNLTPEELESWKCLGKSESSLGEIVEAAVRGFGVKTGYRASVPYVEVKVWIPIDYPRDRKLALLAKLNAELAPYSVARNDEDLGTRLVDAILLHSGETPITFIDFGSEGVLTARLLEILKTEAGRKIQSRVEIMTRYAQTSSPNTLPDSANEWMFVLFADGRLAAVGPQGKFERELPTPYASPAMAERSRRYRTELALKAWTEILYQSGGN